MKTNALLLIVIITILSVSCNKTNDIKTITGKHYQLRKAPNQKAVLILFPSYPGDIEDTQKEAVFLKDIEQEGITTLLLDINQKLYLRENKKQEYAKLLNTILNQNKVLKQNVFIGGFSSGGNLAAVLCDYLLKTKDQLQPKGMFAVDSPIDLERLYKTAKKSVVENVDKAAYNEGLFLGELLETELGNPQKDLTKYKEFSPYLVSTNSTNNIAALKDIKVRFYTEPDLAWQKKNKNRNYEDLSAYSLDKAIQALKTLGSKKAEFITTKERGFRANGERHPHSWNIVERDGLLKWMLH
ncbi:hypothetical protein [Flavobacterium sp.]|uniref:hypothetical protein n=1 Tax=Flavobacterium sp. TaxID=239 RepID=UPI002FD8E61E